MARFLKLKKESIGQSPDELKFRWEQKEDIVKLKLINYNSEQHTKILPESINQVMKYLSIDSVTWINIDGLHDSDILESIVSQLNIDKFIIANIIDTHHRPKIYEYDDCIYISLKMLRFDEETEEVLSENLAIVFRHNLVVTFQEREGDVFDPVRERISKNKKKMRASNSDYLVFALLDVVIDNYIYIISRLGEMIEDLDDELIENPTSSSLEKINRYKVEISYLRKAVKPCRELIINLCKSDSHFISKNNYLHLNELKSNIEQANEAVDNYREILSDQLNIFHTTVSYKLNEILKILTIFSVIFIPMTFIAGVYGTNFDNIPELHLHYGYFLMWGIMIIVALAMVMYFKKKKWF